MTCASAGPCVLARVVEQRAAAASASVSPRRRSRRECAVPNCSSSALRAAPRYRTARPAGASTNGAVAGDRFRGRASSTSAGPMRSSSAASACGATSATRSAPLASDSQARPTAACRCRTTRAGRCRPCRRAAPVSVSVPGVTMRVTWRSTGPLRGRRVADLLADRDRLAELHQLREVLLDRVVRHAGHRDRRARRLRRARSA